MHWKASIPEGPRLLAALLTTVVFALWYCPWGALPRLQLTTQLDWPHLGAFAAGALVSGATGAFLLLLLRLALRTPAALVGAISLLWIWGESSRLKIEALARPVVAADFYLLRDARGLGEVAGLSAPALLFGGVGILVLALNLWLARAYLFRRSWNWRMFLVPAVPAVLAWGVTAAAHLPNTEARALERSASPSLRTLQGPHLTLLRSVQLMRLPAPDFEDLAKTHVTAEAPRTAAPTERPDVVVLLSESFTRLPQQLYDLPFRCLSTMAVSELRTPFFGGGTANVEFEVLTGYPYAALPEASVAYSMYVHSPIAHALPAVFVAAGYRAQATHTFKGSFFDRRKVYPHLGFESFDDIEALGKVPSFGRFADDAAIFANLKAQLEADPQTPKFLHAVTMMAHFPYDRDWLPSGYEREATADPRLKEYGPPVAYYTELVRKHEERLCHFLDYLKSRDRPTVLLFYGDHYPTFENLHAYKLLQEILHPNEPFSIQAQFTNTPVFMFDSRTGTHVLPPVIEPHALGLEILKASGMARSGYWAWLEQNLSTRADTTAYGLSREVLPHARAHAAHALRAPD